MEAEETTLGVPNGHIDDVLNAMATSTPALTVASSSLTFKPSDTAQQAIDEMAAQGVSFFQGSGDFGDVGDPQNNMRMNHQTLVGGTLLSTNPLIAGDVRAHDVSIQNVSLRGAADVPPMSGCP
jgi:hypothetical protein